MSRRRGRSHSLEQATPHIIGVDIIEVDIIEVADTPGRSDKCDGMHDLCNFLLDRRIEQSPAAGPQETSRKSPFWQTFVAKN